MPFTMFCTAHSKKKERVPTGSFQDGTRLNWSSLLFRRKQRLQGYKNGMIMWDVPVCETDARDLHQYVTMALIIILKTKN